MNEVPDAEHLAGTGTFAVTAIAWLGEVSIGPPDDEHGGTAGFVLGQFIAAGLMAGTTGVNLPVLVIGSTLDISHSEGLVDANGLLMLVGTAIDIQAATEIVDLINSAMNDGIFGAPAAPGRHAFRGRSAPAHPEGLFSVRRRSVVRVSLPDSTPHGRL